MSKSRVVLQKICGAVLPHANRATTTAKPSAVSGWLALSFVSFVFLVCLSTPAFAQGEDQTDANPQVESRRGRRERRGGHRDGLMERLNLSPEQREQIRTIRQQTNAEGRLIMQRLRQARRALDEAIYLENADEPVIEARLRDVAAAQAAGVRLRALTELRIRRLLTPEQLNTLREIRQQAIDGRQERRTRGDERRMRRGFNRSRRPNPDSPADNPATSQPAATPRDRRDSPSKPRP